MSRAIYFAEILAFREPTGLECNEIEALLRQQEAEIHASERNLEQLTDEVGQLSALNQSLQEQCAKQEAALKQCVEVAEFLTAGSLDGSWPRLKAALAAAKECLK